MIQRNRLPPRFEFYDGKLHQFSQTPLLGSRLSTTIEDLHVMSSFSNNNWCFSVEAGGGRLPNIETAVLSCSSYCSISIGLSFRLYLRLTRHWQWLYRSGLYPLSLATHELNENFGHLSLVPNGEIQSIVPIREDRIHDVQEATTREHLPTLVGSERVDQ